jgi:hypothetical protein
MGSKEWNSSTGTLKVRYSIEPRICFLLKKTDPILTFPKFALPLSSDQGLIFLV